MASNDKEEKDELRLIKLYIEVTGESESAARNVLMYAIDDAGHRNQDIPRNTSFVERNRPEEIPAKPN
jgi:hypothetical protein